MTAQADRRRVKLLINKAEVPKCTCTHHRKWESDHWSGEDLLRTLGRYPTDADLIEIKDEK